MTRLMISVAAAAVAAAALPALAAQAQAPAQNGISEIIVYGNDPCPRSTDDAIYVCNRLPESQRYRIPERYRESGTLQQRQAWANRAKALETVGATGTFSCSPVGPGGYTGCLTQVIREAREQRRQQAEDGNPER